MKQYTHHTLKGVQSTCPVALTHNHHGLLTRHRGHGMPPMTFITRHLFIKGHLLHKYGPI